MASANKSASASTALAAALAATALLLMIATATASAVCQNVECGRGKCVASKHSAVGFNCRCQPGWLQSAIDGYTDGNDFLPCVFPNCTLDLSCTRSHVSDPEPPSKPALNPCRWVSCGGGACQMKSAFNWSCNCHPGFHNLNNRPAFPCFKKCALGKNCVNVGATLPGYKPTSSPRKTMQL